MNIIQQIADSYNQVCERLAKAAQIAGTNSDDIMLVVVTKARSIEIVRAVIAAGARHIGENYPAEGAGKIAMIEKKPIEWHMIGHIQSRKAKLVCQNFDWVHSVDRAKIANRLNQFAGENNRKIPILLQCNISGEISKQGWPAWDESQWSELSQSIGPLLNLEHIQIQGLMTVPPFSADPEGARIYFRRLRRLQSFLKAQFPLAKWDQLSMGMSNDFEVAVQEGATIVRVGSAIVGERK